MPDTEKKRESTKRWKEKPDSTPLTPSSFVDHRNLEFGDYRNLEEIGRGGMGRVYKAYDAKNRRWVALKTLLAGEAADELEIRRFEREARATFEWNHPNIVRVYETGVNQGQPFFVMEYVEGASLKEFIKEEKVSFRQIAEIMAKIARAVAYAHENGVIHRDLKPENVMMQGREPKVMDFGLAKMKNASQKLSETGAVMGTLQYMSPEQGEGQGRGIDERSDVYALGAILYEFLARRPPFTGKTYAAILQQILHEDPTPPSLVKPRIPRELESICLKAMEKDKQKRYRSAAEFGEDLSAFCEGKVVRARRMRGMDIQIRKKAKRHKVLIAAVLVGACMALTGFLFYRLGRDTGARETPPSTRSEKSAIKPPDEKSASGEPQKQEIPNRSGVLVSPASIRALLTSVPTPSEPSKYWGGLSNSPLPLNWAIFPDDEKLNLFDCVPEKRGDPAKVHSTEKLWQIVRKHEENANSGRAMECLIRLRERSPEILWRIVRNAMASGHELHARFYLEYLRIGYPDAFGDEAARAREETIQRQSEFRSIFLDPSMYDLLSKIGIIRLAYLERLTETRTLLLEELKEISRRRQFLNLEPWILLENAAVYLEKRAFPAAERELRMVEDMCAFSPEDFHLRVGKDFCQALCHMYQDRHPEALEIFRRIHQGRGFLEEVEAMRESAREYLEEQRNSGKIDMAAWDRKLAEEGCSCIPLLEVKFLQDFRNLQKSGGYKQCISFLCELGAMEGKWRHLAHHHMGNLFLILAQRERNSGLRLEHLRHASFHLTCARRWSFEFNDPIFLLGRVAEAIPDRARAEKYFRFCQDNPPQWTAESQEHIRRFFSGQ